MFPVDYNENPFIVIWELTRACQLECLHCRAEAQHQRHPDELTFEEGKKLIDDIYEMNNPMLVFTGGDPLEREDMYDIADYAIKKGVRVSITPSATANVTKEAMEKAKRVLRNMMEIVITVNFTYNVLIFAFFPVRSPHHERF